MTIPNINENREQWLNTASELILTNVLNEAPQYMLDNISYKVSLGSLTKKSNTLGVCWSRSASTANVNEIFITPFCDDSNLILATITHELIHALSDNKDGHGAGFKSIAIKAGLEGKMTATTATPELDEYFNELIEMIGKIPHSKLDPSKKPNVQKGRQLKMVCPTCDFKFNTSKAQIERIQVFTCPACQSDNLIQA